MDPAPASPEICLLADLFEHSDQASRREVTAIRDDLVRHLAQKDPDPGIINAIIMSLASAVCWWIHESANINEYLYQQPLERAAAAVRDAGPPHTEAAAHELLYAALPEWLRLRVFHDRHLS